MANWTFGKKAEYQMGEYCLQPTIKTKSNFTDQQKNEGIIQPI